MGCNGGGELTFLKWKVARAAPLNPVVILLRELNGIDFNS